MKLKKCSCCSKDLNTKDVINKGRNSMGLWLNCKSCGSTILLPNLKFKKKV